MVTYSYYENKRKKVPFLKELFLVIYGKQKQHKRFVVTENQTVD